MQFSIKPVLKAAIKSLDLQLDAEISRYQQTKSLSPYKSPNSNQIQSIFAQNSPTEHLGKGYTLVKVTEAGTELQLSPSESLTNAPKELFASLVDQSLGSTQLPANDYLESSEELLQSFPDEEPPKEKIPHWTDFLSTPLGIGSLLLLLIGTGLLSMARIFPDGSPKTAQNSSETESSQPEQTSESSFSQNPNFSTEDTSMELGNLSAIKPKSSKSSTPNGSIPPNPSTPNPAQTPVTSAPAAKPATNPDLATALIPPSLRSPTNQPSTAAPPTTPVAPANPPQKSSPPSPSPTPTSVPTLTPPPPPPMPSQLPVSQTPVQNPSPDTVGVNSSPVSSNDNYYYVLVDYTDAESMQRARSVVKDAYLTNFPQGIKIQMGAFDRQEDADILVETLKQKGISASVYNHQIETTN